MKRKEQFDKKGKTILVTGGTGHQGGAAAGSLLAAGWDIRALVRDTEKTAAKALARKGAELVRGDLEDRGSLERALNGVYGVFSVQTWQGHGVAGEVRQGTNLGEAAKAAGVKHFIYSSVSGADQKTGIPFFESKATIERRIKSLGLPATIFRPVYFMFNFSSPEIHATIMNGALVMGVKPDRLFQMVAVEDLGKFVAKAFEQPDEYIGKTMELAGDEMTMPRVAAVFSRIIGKTVGYMQQSTAEVRRFNAAVAKMFDWINEHGYHADIAALRALHPGLMSLETWLRKTRWAKVA